MSTFMLILLGFGASLLIAIAVGSFIRAGTRSEGPKGRAKSTSKSRDELATNGEAASSSQDSI